MAMRSGKSSTAPVEFLELDLPGLEALDAAHIDRRHGNAVRRLRLAERPAAALRTEMMPDAMCVEGVGGKILLGRLQGEFVARHEGEEMAALRAQGAIALD